MVDWKKVKINKIGKTGDGGENTGLVKGIAHACFGVSDLEASIRFYSGVLGLEPAFEFIDENGERFGVYLYAGIRNFIELFKGNPVSDSPASFRHISLEVADMENASEKIKQAGCEIGAISQGCDGTMQAWLKDPDGNPIELFCYTGKSMQNTWLGRRG